MKTVEIQAADLTNCIQQAQCESILITRNSKPVALLVSVEGLITTILFRLVAKSGGMRSDKHIYPVRELNLILGRPNSSLEASVVRPPFPTPPKRLPPNSRPTFARPECSCSPVPRELSEHECDPASWLLHRTCQGIG